MRAAVLCLLATVPHDPARTPPGKFRAEANEPRFPHHRRVGQRSVK